MSPREEHPPVLPAAAVEHCRYIRHEDCIELSDPLSEEKKKISTAALVTIIPSAEKGESQEYRILHVEDVKGSGPALPELRTVTVRKLPAELVAAYQIHPSRFDLSDRTSTTVSSPNLHIIVSTRSGTCLAPSVYDSLLLPLLKQLKLPEPGYNVHHTQSAQTVTDLTSSIFLPAANHGHAQHIILLSGDGGIIDIINALVSASHTPSYRRPTITLLPMGTGNGLANSVGITADNTMGLSTLARGEPTILPLFRATFSSGARLLVEEGTTKELLPMSNTSINHQTPTLYGAVVASYALHATLVADSDTSEYRQFGVQRFAMAAKAALFPPSGSSPHVYTARVSLLPRGATVREEEGEEGWRALPRTQHAYVLATLVSQLEAGFTISPDSKPLDGKLRVVEFGPLEGAGEEVMKTMALAYKGGKHVLQREVGYHDVEGVKLEVLGEEEERWRRVCVDGKIVLLEEGGWMEVRRMPLQEGVVDLIVKT